METQFPIPKSPARDRFIDASCKDAANLEVRRMAKRLAEKVPRLGIGGAFRLLAAIGLVLEEQ